MQRITHRVAEPITQAGSPIITYTFNRLNHRRGIRAHVSTRHGGVSPAPWDSLNFSVSRGDTQTHVDKNRALFASALDISPEHTVRCHQVHGTGIGKVDWSDAGTMVESTDGLITDTKNLPLTWVFADCAPILIYDPVTHSLGGCHAGWRGTINGVATATLWAMQAAYGVDPATVIVGIGPSIGPESYEVGQEVVEMAHAKLRLPRRFFHYPNGPDRNPYFNLWYANAAQLVEAGVRENNLEISGLDTAQNVADFFSHRAERGQCGLFAMMAWLEK